MGKREIKFREGETFAQGHSASYRPETEQLLQCYRDGFYKYLQKNEDWFCSLLFSLVGVRSPWGQNTVVLSPCFALCGLDMATLSALWGQDEGALCSRKREVLRAACLVGRAVGS